MLITNKIIFISGGVPLAEEKYNTFAILSLILTPTVLCYIVGTQEKAINLCFGMGGGMIAKQDTRS